MENKTKNKNNNNISWIKKKFYLQIVKVYIILSLDMFVVNTKLTNKN